MLFSAAIIIIFPRIGLQHSFVFNNNETAIQKQYLLCQVDL